MRSDAAAAVGDDGVVGEGPRDDVAVRSVEVGRAGNGDPSVSGQA